MTGLRTTTRVLSLLLLTASGALLASDGADAQNMIIEVAQESAAGVGDFDSNILGTVQAFRTTGTVASYYAYSGSSFGNDVPALGTFRNQVNTMFVIGSDGLGLITLHGPRRGGGSAGDLTAESQHDVSVGAFTTPLDVLDDPDDTFTFSNADTRLTASTTAGGSTSDGFAVRFTDPEPVIYSELLAFSNSIEGWTAHGDNGSSLSAVPEVGRRVRFGITWQIDPANIPVPQIVAADEPGWRLLSVPFGGIDVADLARLNLVAGVPAGATHAAQFPGLGYTNPRGQLAGNLFHEYEGTATIRNTANTADSTAIVYVPAPDTDHVFEAGRGLWWYWYDADFDLTANNPDAWGGGTGVSFDLLNPAFSMGDVEGTPRLTNVSTTFPLATTIDPTHDEDGNGVPDGTVPQFFYMGGNPFAVPFNVDGISATDGTVHGLVYAWDPTANSGAGGHVPLSRSGLLDGSGDYASVWQGLMIEVTPPGASGPTISYAASMTDGAQDPVFYGKSASGAPSLDYALTLSGASGASDYAWLRFLPDAEIGFDRHDGSKYAGGSARIAFRIQREGTHYHLAMNALPDGTAEPLARKQNVALDFTTTDAGTFTLAWDGALADGWKAFLVDRETGGRIKMWRESSYTFTAAAGDWTNRFFITVRPAADVASVAPEAALKTAETRIGEAYPNPASGASRIEVVLGSEQTVRVAVVDALGREVAVAHDGPLATGSNVIALPMSALANGSYVVRVTSAEVSETRRLTVVR